MAERDAQTYPATGTPMQVLVVEDDVMLADCLAEGLEDHGHVVCGVVSTVAEALLVAQRHKLDAAVLDMQLAGGELGSDFADLLAASGDLGNTGILYVTGEAERVHQEARVGHACLDKPFTLAALDRALAIVRDIACEGGTSHPLPRGLQLLRSVKMRPQPAV
jgi:CheY-like chemotaxis protein